MSRGANTQHYADTKEALNKLYDHIRSVYDILGEFPKYDLKKFKSSIDFLELLMGDLHSYSFSMDHPSSKGIAMGATDYTFTLVGKTLDLVDERIKKLETFLVMPGHQNPMVATAVTKLKETYVEVKGVVDTATKQSFATLGRKPDSMANP